MTKTKLNKKKYMSMLHYIICKTSSKLNVGRVVLYKILYFADFNFYEKYNELISGDDYRKIPFGPAPCNFNQISEKLEKEGKIKIEETNFCGQKQYKYSFLKNQDYNLTQEELSEIDKAINIIGSMTAKQASAYSHEDTPWKVSDMKEIIDPELVFYRDETYSVREDLNNGCCRM